MESSSLVAASVRQGRMLWLMSRKRTSPLGVRDGWFYMCGGKVYVDWVIGSLEGESRLAATPSACL